MVLLAFGFAPLAYAVPTIDWETTVPPVEERAGDGTIEIDDDAGTDNVEEQSPTSAALYFVLTATPGGPTSDPGDDASITIGSCTVLFTNDTSDLDCESGSAVIDRWQSGSPITPGEVASTIVNLFNFTDAVSRDSRDLTISILGGGAASTTITLFAEDLMDNGEPEPNFEMLNIFFDYGGQGFISVEENSGGEYGVEPVAQITHVVISGTMEEGDEYTVSSLDLAAPAVYTVKENDDIEDVRDGLIDAIEEDEDYELGTTFLVTDSGNDTIIFTATTPGTEFDVNVSSTAAPVAPVAHEFRVSFGDVEAEWEFVVVVNGNEYSHVADSDDVGDLILDLITAVEGSPDIDTCSNDGGTLLCEAAIPGELLAVSVDVRGGPAPAPDPQPSSSSRTSGQSAPTTVAQAVANIQTWINQLVQQLVAMGGTPPAGVDNLGSVPSPSDEAPGRDLTLGHTGSDVLALQNLLISLGYSIPDGPTTYFGSQTRSALAAYQEANGISPAAGYFGPTTRAYMEAAGLAGLWW